MRLEECGSLAVIQLNLGAADVDERVRTGALVAEPEREPERALSPRERRLGLLGEHREL